MLRIAIPNKGRLSKGVRELLERAGLGDELAHTRALQVNLGRNIRALFARANDIPRLVAGGAADLGITGRDLVEESGVDVVERLDLGMGTCRLSLAVCEESEVRSLETLPQSFRVATSFPTLTRRFLSSCCEGLELVPISGAAELAPHLGIADGIVDLVSTGSTLKLNGLREVQSFLESSATVISPKESGEPRKDMIEFLDALSSVLLARNKRYLMTNVPRSALDEVKRILPGISGPTIVDVMDRGSMVGAHAVVDRREVYQVISQLKNLGAEGILVTDIERLMP